MKDLVIPGRAIVRELWMVAACVLFAFGLNAYAIVRFKTAWSELLTTVPVTLAVAFVVYALLALVRGLIAGVRFAARRF
jgi:uncharacterized membrane protein YbhN (UPF0104 family)